MASDPEPQEAKVLADEKAQQDTTASTAVQPGPSTATRNRSASNTATYPPTSPPASPPVSPPISPDKRSTANEDYYSSKPRYDKLGNLIPDRKKPGAMSSVYGSSKIRLPGDLGPNDPRRPRSPAPNTLPGDLGPNDPRRPRSTNSSPMPQHRRQVSDPLESPNGGVRLQKDPPEPGAENDSEEDADADNDNDTDAEEGSRGRRKNKRPEPGKTTSGKSVNVRSDSADSEAASVQNHSGHKPDPTKGESKLSFKVTPPSGSGGRKMVHPANSYDAAHSGTSTPAGSDDESRVELLAAQKLSLTMSAVHSTPSAHRVIRQIIRGDYAHFQHEAEEGRKRQRMYLVATDISPEAEYALEWTIGTVLRDGDTLFAVYAVDEENAGNEGGVAIGHGAESVRDTAAIVQGLGATNVPPQSPLAKSTVAADGSRSRVAHGSAEAERRSALEDITERCVRLLRKTRLQVRVVVEVFHCKSPRHMITEVIDFLSPTLVVIGSRGRSAVKGVLLGSFSNYLVTKSSVPVMVARKKLRKHSKSAKVRNPDGTTVPYTGISGRAGRLSNMIEAPTKGLRVKGWDKVGID